MITTNGTLLHKQAALLCSAPAVQKVSISLHSFEGNHPSGTMEDYLTTCTDFAVQAANSGKRCALRLWNLDGALTQGANAQNTDILIHLHAKFPGEWKEGRRGITMAPSVHLEWGEKFDWPDLTAPETGITAFCYGLRDHVGVLCDGTVVPCCLDHEGDIPLGNLYHQSLSEILSSPRAQAIYNGFSQGCAAEELCRRCGYIRRFQ